MDLNEKLAARRRELAIETEKTAHLEAARKRELAIQAEKARQVEQDAIQAEVARRLAEKGIELPAKEAPPAAVIPESAVNAAVDKAITKAASERMTGTENATFFFLALMGLGGFFVAWWVGLALVACSLIYLNRCTEEHKQEIIAEGKAKTAEAEQAKPSVAEAYSEWR